MNVWLLDEGTPGHTVQTKGIGGLLESKILARTNWIDVRLKLRGWQRPIARLLVGKVCRKGSALKLAHILYPGLVLPEEKPDLIISSCGKSAYLNHLLSVAYGARSIFIGERKPFPADWFDLILTPVSDGSKNELIMPIIETGQSVEGALSAQKAFWPDGAPERCWTMLIGGASRTHPFKESDWSELADAMNKLAGKYQFKWLLSTSRRTGKDAEEILKKGISPEYIEQAVWWDEEPKRCLSAYLGAGERIFVTQDSLSMMSEGLAVGKRVELVLPENWEMPEDSINGRYVRRLQGEELIGRTQIVDLAEYCPEGDGTVSLEEKKETFAKKLLSWVAGERVVQ
ncbi:ELM1/GtrOC1 family putative glycosyltransferase [Luteolibacter sp. AS25]|uniref:ELM1/GtrOC1 family putative glycosyltransferase n=1 Tax=Luteolibacter sp. AS25 TaxID=3135776 RepID=UPI00398AF683